MQQADVTYRLQPGGRMHGQIRVPGDKSISHRSIMLGALAEGVTQVSGFLESEDALATIAAFRAMGVRIDGPAQGRVEVHGVGLHGLQQPEMAIDCGNSGTSMRLLAGLLAGQAFASELIGDESLSIRPMGRIAEPLRQMGAQVELSASGTPPIRIQGGQRLRGIEYQSPVPSAQIKSCILLAGLYADGETCVTEPPISRDHTERMLTGMGYAVRQSDHSACLQGGGQLQAGQIDVPADISSAAFFMVGASIAKGSDLLLEHVGINPTRTGIIEILRLMGADIDVLNERSAGGEPVADLRIRYAPLRGITIPEHLVPLAIDEFPVLFIAAACAEGETVLTGAAELRVKESDRIAVMADGLRTLGIQAEPLPDGMRIQGGQLGGGRLASHHDHRIAMSFAIAALRAEGEIQIDGCATVNTSFPSFPALARQVGMQIEVKEAAV